MNFGRLPLGKISVLEADEDLPDEVLQHLVRPAIGHTLAQGGRVLLVPPASLSADDIWAGISDIATPTILGQSFRVVDVSREARPAAAGGRPELVPTIVSPNSLVSSASNPIAGDAELTRWLKGTSASAKPGLVVVYVSGLESLSAALRVAITPDVAATFIANVQTTLGGANVHMVALARPGDPARDGGPFPRRDPDPGPGPAGPCVPLRGEAMDPRVRPHRGERRGSVPTSSASSEPRNPVPAGRSVRPADLSAI